jgi:hypothetical protein
MAEQRVRTLSGPGHTGFLALCHFISFWINLELTTCAGISATEEKCNTGVGTHDMPLCRNGKGTLNMGNKEVMLP